MSDQAIEVTGSTLTCVYCGQAYPPGTPSHGSQVLTDHIKVCEKHPMREAEATIVKLRKALADLVGASEKSELDQMEMIFRVSPVPDEDKNGNTQCYSCTEGGKPMSDIFGVTAIDAGELRWLKGQENALRTENELLKKVEAWKNERINQQMQEIQSNYRIMRELRVENQALKTKLTQADIDCADFRNYTDKLAIIAQKGADEVKALKEELAHTQEALKCLHKHIQNNAPREQNNADIIARAVRIILRADKKGLNPGVESVKNAMASLDELEKEMKP